MNGKFIRLLMVAVLLSTATVAFAGPVDLVITTSGREVSLCAGEETSLKVFVTDTTGELRDFSYQWFYNTELVAASSNTWVMVPSATDSILQLSNVHAVVSLGNSGYYYCRVYADEDNYRNSEKIEVEVAASKPSVGGVISSADVCEGTPISMEATNVSGQNSRTWYFGDVPVSYGNAYHINSASPEDSGEYTFVASNACGDSVISYYVSVTELPRIVTQPRSAGICAGEDLHFIVSATGDDLSYQWYYDGAPYPAVNGSDTNDTLTIAQAEHDPQLYSNTFNVQVSNACATVTSRNVGTIVSEIPHVVGNPDPETVCEGTEISIYANATTDYPTDTITYQWYLNGEPIEGSNTNILTFAMDSAHMGEYYCEFTNGCGTVPSNAAYMMVKMPPKVETQPYDITVCEGELAQLYTKITGLEPISYTWLNDNGADLAYTDITTQNITGVHTNTLVANPAAEVHEHFYFCHASNECGSVNTDTVYLTITQAIEVYPALESSTYACSDGELTISIANRIYAGSHNLDIDEFDDEGVTFAWHKQGESTILSETPELHFNSIQNSDRGYYVCDVTNSCGTETAGPIFISVIASPNITVQPQDLDVCTGGGTFSITLEAEGDNLRYSWYRNGNYIGNDSPTYTAPTVAPEYGGTYYCVVSSTFEEHQCPTVYSDTITVTVGTTPVIIWEPTPRVMALCEGEEYGLRMRAEGDGIHYQWYNNGNLLAGQTTDSLHISAVTRDNDGQFYCIASNACAQARTVNATLTVNAAPDMTLGPDIHACRGEAIVIGPQGDTEYGHYSWNYGTYGYQPTLTLTSSSTNINVGRMFILEVSDSAHGNCVARDTIVVTFHDYFDIAFDSTPIVTCGEFVLNAGVGAAEYMWSTTDMTSSINVDMSGLYMVTVDGDGYGCTSSAAVNVTIGEDIIINLGSDITASVDSVVEIGVPAVFESYRWSTGAVSPMLAVSGEDYGIGSHTFWIEVTSNGCYASDTIVINFLESGIDEENMPEFSIYPNPASDYVNIVSSNGAMDEIQVYDITGRLVINRKIEDEMITLNVAKLVDATYFVRIIYNDGKTGVSKLIINR